MVRKFYLGSSLLPPSFAPSAEALFLLFSSDGEDDLSLLPQCKEATGGGGGGGIEDRQTEAAAAAVSAACNYKSPMFYGQSSTNGPERVRGGRERERLEGNN